MLSCFIANASNASITNTAQSRVIIIVQNAGNYIKNHGIEKAIVKFKHAQDIFMGNYDGEFFISPLHPELIGKNQSTYKDASGSLVVQEEVEKAKAGGGWLKGRWVYNNV